MAEDKVDTAKKEDAAQDDGTQQTVPEQDVAAGAREGDKDTLTIEDTVVEKIVAITLRDADGILEMKGNIISTIQEGLGGTNQTKGISVEINDDKTTVIDLAIIMEYGKSAPKIFSDLRGIIARNVKDMTGLDVYAINLRVVDVFTREEFEAKKAPKSKSADKDAASDDAGSETTASDQ